ALVAYGEEHTRQQRLAEAVEASQDALTLSRELYLRGLVDFLTVLDNQRSLYVAQDQRVQSERTLVVSLIALYKALGGGWEPMEMQPRSPLRMSFSTNSHGHTSKNFSNPYGPTL